MTTTSEATDLERAARRVDTAVERAELLDAGGRRVAMDLKAAVEEFHREGVTRIVRRLKDDPRGKELLFDLVDDPVVYALLTMHGIVRADPATLARRALEEVRPYLESHGGGVRLVGVELPVVRVSLSGTCTGCSSSSTTLREVVERAIVAAVPGAHQVEVVPAEPAPALVPLASVGLRPHREPEPRAVGRRPALVQTARVSNRTRISTGVTYARPDADDALRRGWEPLRVLGAGSDFSLVLPDARPTRGQLYAPRGVLLDPAGDGRCGGATRVIAADTGNHRLLVWPDLPGSDGADSAVVVGQPGPTAEGPQAGGRGPERGLHLPTGLTRAGDLLIVADGWNHRLVGFDAALDADDPAPVWMLGQPDLASVAENAGGEVGGHSFYWPFGVLWHDGWLWVADTGNRRVLGWHGLPAGPGGDADVVLGQPSPHERGENRGGDVAADSFRWPHQIVVTDGVLWVADAGNHRVLGWNLPGAGDRLTDRPADHLLGQGSFTTARELPHVPQGPARLRFPYAVTASGGDLVVADTANNRVLAWAGRAGAGAPADTVLGQHGFDPAGENRWSAVTPDSLCWPYGLSSAADPRFGELLAVADSGNNRVVLWHRDRHRERDRERDHQEPA